MYDVLATWDVVPASPDIAQQIPVLPVVAPVGHLILGGLWKTLVLRQSQAFSVTYRQKPLAGPQADLESFYRHLRLAKEEGDVAAPPTHNTDGADLPLVLEALAADVRRVREWAPALLQAAELEGPDVLAKRKMELRRLVSNMAQLGASLPNFSDGQCHGRVESTKLLNVMCMVLNVRNRNTLQHTGVPGSWLHSVQSVLQATSCIR